MQKFSTPAVTVSPVVLSALGTAVLLAIVFIVKDTLKPIPFSWMAVFAFTSYRALGRTSARTIWTVVTILAAIVSISVAASS